MVTNKGKFFIFGSFILTALLVIVVFLTTTSTKQRQEIRKQAATPTGTITAKLNPTSGNYFVGDRPVTEIRLSPGASPITISVIQIYLTYSYSGTSPEIEIQDYDTIKAGIQIQPGSLPLDYTLLNSVTIDQVAKKVTIGLAGYTTSGYSLSQEVVFGKINFWAKAATVSITLSFDQTLSKVTQSSDGKDILLTPNATAVYSVGIDTTPPETTIGSGPAEGSTIRINNTAFTFQGTDNRTPTTNLLYSWKLDGPSPLDWSSFLANTSVNLNSLADGTYTFQVKAKDETGLTDATPASRTFIIDTKTYLNFQIKFQGITSFPAYGSNKNVSLKVKNTIISQSVQVTSNSLGIYSGQANLGNLAAGNYEILIKGPAHLQKNFSNITLNIGNNSQDWSATLLKAGDLAGGGTDGSLPNNMIDASDLGKLISVFNPLGSVPSGTLADLNSDGKVDVSDLGLLISNFNPGVYGD